MFQVIDVIEEAGKIAGFCDEVKLMKWLSDAVTLSANKADLEGWKGYLDICTEQSGLYLTLPREVGTVLAVNFGGRPTLGLNELFNFHLNGPGDCHGKCQWVWQDLGGSHPTYRDIVVPSKVVAFVQKSVDAGKKLIVYGYDVNGLPLTTVTSAGVTKGYQVPTIYGYALPDSEAPTIARITGVQKDPTIGTIRLNTLDDSSTIGSLLAVYEPDETIPEYRRIRLGRCCKWVRIAYRRNNPQFTSVYDRVPLKSRIGFLLALKAVKFYSESDVANAHSFESDAARLEIEAQLATEAPTYFPIQVVDGGNNLIDPIDYDVT